MARGDDEAPTRVCRACGHLAGPYLMLCPACRAVLPREVRDEVPAPSESARRRRRVVRRGLVGAAALAAIAALATVTVLVVGHVTDRPPGPSSVAEAYLTALADHDCEAAAEHLARGFGGAEECFDELDLASVDLAVVEVVDETVDSGAATVRVAATLGGEPVEVAVELVNVRSVGRWRVVDFEVGDVPV